MEKRGGLGGRDSRELIPLSALDDIVQYKNGAMIAGFEDEHILILWFLMVEDLVDLEGHGLTWPHVGNLAEPAICVEGFRFIIVDR